MEPALRQTVVPLAWRTVGDDAALDVTPLRVQPTDPATFIASAEFLLVVAVVAFMTPAPPAPRVARVDPVEALRAY